MIFDYILVGINLNSLMIAYYLNKFNNKVLLIDKKSKDEHKIYYKNNTFLKLPEYSNNDVNFLNFLNDINVDFRSIGHRLENIDFEIIKNFKITEIITICIEFMKEFTNDYTSKDIKFINKSNLFSDESIEYIKSLCNFYNLNYYDITLLDFTNIINNCILNEFFLIDEKKLFEEIIKKYNNDNIEISYEEEFYDIDNKNIKTNKRTIDFNNKCLLFLSPKNNNLINDRNGSSNIYKTKPYNIYNYIWDTEVNIEKHNFKSIKYNYIKDNNNYVVYSKNDIHDEIDNNLFFLGNNYKKIVHTHHEYSDVNNKDNFIIINNLLKIEDNVINNYKLLNKLFNKKTFRIYKNDSIVDIIKLIIILNYLIK
jgi:hypothetical protein